MQSAVSITGVGLVSALGHGVEANWRALLQGQCIRTPTRVEPAHSANSRVAGLAVEAAREAIENARWSPDSHDPYDTALVVATSKGPIEHWCTPAAATSDNLARAGESDFGLADLATELSVQVGLTRSPRLTVSAACASGLVALVRATMMIQAGQVGRALVVAAEASVHPLFVGSFQRLGVLAAEGERCRPFDRSRTGFLISEAGAAICIERVDQRKPRRRVIMNGYRLAAEATHLIAGDPAGRTLQHVLTHLGTTPPDLIHAHGTGTQRGDKAELAAINRALAANPSATPPHIYSHKAALGHTLGAAGLVAAVLNQQCHLHQCVPPNINTPAPLAGGPAIISAAPVERTIRHSLACANGFGGAVAAVSLASS